jgi:hypothetical protein
MLDGELARSFYLWIPLNDSDNINQKLEESLIVENLTRELISGKLSPSDYFEIVESLTTINIDDYIDEIEANVIDTISTTNELTNEQKGLILYGF